MKTTISSVLTGVMLVVFSATSAFPQAPVEKALLWEISGKNIKQPSYLYGTLHILCGSELVVSEKLKDRFKSTQQLYLELDMDDPTMMLATIQGMALKDNVTLKSLFEPPDYKLVSDYFTKNVKVSLETFDKMKPFFVQTLLAVTMMNCPQASWEGELVKMAEGQKIETLGLETVQEQIAVMDKIPYKEQVAALVDLVKDEAKAKKELETLKKNYFDQDIAALEKMMENSPELGQYGEAFLKNRNELWVPIIEKAATAKPTFFAVGAGHLGGANGVIALLRKAGFKVVPVAQ